MSKRILTSAFLLFLAATLSSWAETINIVGNHRTETIPFHGSANRLDVMGNQNTLTVTGRGENIDVMGNQNHLIIDAQLDKIDVVGNDNQIKIVRRKGRPEPKVNSMGKDNNVSYEDAK